MDWEFKKDCRSVNLDEFWYDLTDGGYIDPSELLENKEQIKNLTTNSLVTAFKNLDIESDLGNDTGVSSLTVYGEHSNHPEDYLDLCSKLYDKQDGNLNFLW